MRRIAGREIFAILIVLTAVVYIAFDLLHTETLGQLFQRSFSHVDSSVEVGRTALRITETRKQKEEKLFVVWDEILKESPNAANSIHVCGYDFGTLARTLFPDFRIVRILGTEKRANASKRDILLVSGGCHAVKGYPGRMLYADGEPGEMPIDRHPRTYYIGIETPPRPVLDAIPVTYMAIVSLEKMYSLTLDSLLLPRVQPTPRPKFLVYMNGHCVDFREHAFDKIVDMAAAHRIDSPVAAGKCHGTHIELQDFKDDRNERRQNCKKLEDYRFAIVMENINRAGYMTEKILDAFCASAVPIYYGDKDLALDMFNEKAFVYFDIDDPKPALDRILHLETNQTAYAEAVGAPILKDGKKTLEKYFSLSDDVGGGALKKRIRGMLGLA